MEKNAIDWRKIIAKKCKNFLKNMLHFSSFCDIIFLDNGLKGALNSPCAVQLATLLGTGIRYLI